MVALGAEHMPKGIPLTQEEFKQRRREISQAAIELIAVQGFNQTPMHQIAKAVGLGKSTLYDYFPSKDDIVVYVIHEQLADLARRAKSIIEKQVSPEVRLRQVMEMHLSYLIENRVFYLRMTYEAQHLKIESQDRIQVDRYAFQDMIKDLIAEGIEEGCFRPVDTTMAMKTVISMMTPVVYTSRPSGTPEEMLEAGLEIILGGLLK
jgi:AcrR family transcriptional regulator